MGRAFLAAPSQDAADQADLLFRWGSMGHDGAQAVKLGQDRLCVDSVLHTNRVQRLFRTPEFSCFAFFDLAHNSKVAANLPPAAIRDIPNGLVVAFKRYPWLTGTNAAR